MNSAITHVIFDLDGLLIDTEAIYTKCYEEFCAKFGKEFSWKIKMQQMGKAPDESARVIIDYLQLPITVQQHHEIINPLLYSLFPNCQLMPGAKELVEYFSKHNMPMCIATGSDQSSFDIKTQKHSWLLQHMHHSVCCGSDPEVRQGKPAPDAFLVAAKRFKEPPSDSRRALVFEDAPNGVAGALAAGMRVVWCPDKNADVAEFADYEDVVVVPSLTQFNPEVYSLPAFD